MVGECFGEAWGHGETRGMLGNALGRLGDGWEVWGRFGECSGDALGSLGEAWGLVPYTFGLSEEAWEAWCGLGMLGSAVELVVSNAFIPKSKNLALYMSPLTSPLYSHKGTSSPVSGFSLGC